jgi:hypothetical protein
MKFKANKKFNSIRIVQNKAIENLKHFEHFIKKVENTL